MAATIDIEVRDEQVRLFLAELAKRFANLTPLMRNIGEIVVERAMQSFAAGTSPAGVPWKPSHRAVRQGGKTLVDSTILSNSIHEFPGPTSVRVGTPVQYAGTHQFGAKRGSFGVVTVMVREYLRKSKLGKSVTVRKHSRQIPLPWGNIPARPFLGVAPQDWNDIHDAVLEYAMRGMK